MVMPGIFFCYCLSFYCFLVNKKNEILNVYCGKAKAGICTISPLMIQIPLRDLCALWVQHFYYTDNRHNLILLHPYDRGGSCSSWIPPVWIDLSEKSSTLRDEGQESGHQFQPVIIVTDKSLCCSQHLITTSANMLYRDFLFDPWRLVLSHVFGNVITWSYFAHTLFFITIIVMRV